MPDLDVRVIFFPQVISKSARKSAEKVVSSISSTLEDDPEAVS